MAIDQRNNASGEAGDGKKVLIVIGMHRSGTSATTGAMQCLEVQLGKRLYSGHQDINAKGYFEHSDIADTNEEILFKLGSSWDDPLIQEDSWWLREDLKPYAEKIRTYIRRDFARSRLWAIKDPRVCRLLPFWLNILAEEKISPYFLFVVRSPGAVSNSLQKRDKFSQGKSFLLWALHYLEAERNSRDFPRVFTSFNRFLERPVDELLRLERMLGLNFPVSVEDASTCLDQFLSKDLLHHKGGDVNPTEDPFAKLVNELNDRLEQAALSTTAHDGIEADDLWRKMMDIQQSFSPVLVEHLRSIGRQRGQVELTVNRMWRSWSVYAGKPIRFIERLIGRDV